MWPNDYFDNHMFSNGCSVYLADWDHSNFITSTGGCAPIVHCQFVAGFQPRFDLELLNECVYIEIAILDGFSLLTGNSYYLSNTGN
jgi:hypothetical protein